MWLSRHGVHRAWNRSLSGKISNRDDKQISVKDRRALVENAAKINSINIKDDKKRTEVDKILSD